jgi:antitoxin CptB
MASLADAARVSRIKWGCRRGLLENDLIIQKFFQQHGASLTNEQADALMLLMNLPDNDLLDLFLSRTDPRGEYAVEPVHQLLALMRRPACHQDSREPGQLEP